MVRKFKRLFLIAFLPLITVTLSSCEKYLGIEKAIKVCFQNYDQSVLYETKIKAGSDAVYRGEIPSRPSDNEYSHYVYTGWDKSLRNIEKDTTFTAQYSLEYNIYTVMFDTDGGNEIKTQSVEYNKKANKPVAPSKVGYIFNSWKDENGEKFDFNTPITKNIVLKAMYNIFTFNIIYDLDGGTNDIRNPFTYTIEDSFTLYAPSKDKYDFVGWYTKQEGGEAISDIIPGSYGDLHLYARWNHKNTTNKVKIYTNDSLLGSVKGEGNYTYNSYVEISVSPNSGADLIGIFTSPSENYDSINDWVLLTTDYNYGFLMEDKDVSLYVLFTNDVSNKKQGRVKYSNESSYSFFFDDENQDSEFYLAENDCEKVFLEKSTYHPIRRDTYFDKEGRISTLVEYDLSGNGKVETFTYEYSNENKYNMTSEITFDGVLTYYGEYSVEMIIEDNIKTVDTKYKYYKLDKETEHLTGFKSETIADKTRHLFIEENDLDLSETFTKEVTVSYLGNEEISEYKYSYDGSLQYSFSGKENKCIENTSNCEIIKYITNENDVVKEGNQYLLKNEKGTYTDLVNIIKDKTNKKFLVMFASSLE